MTDADTDYQSPVPPDEQINPNAAPPLPGDGGMATDSGDSLLPGQPGQGQGILGTPTAPTADPWTITDVPADAPDETAQAPDAESAQE